MHSPHSHAAFRPTRLDDLTQEVIRRAAARPELAALHTTFRATTQQLRVDVDREKATLLGVPVEDLYSAIQAQFGSLTVSQFNQFSRVWWVILQSDAKYRHRRTSPASTCAGGRAPWSRSRRW